MRTLLIAFLLGGFLGLPLAELAFLNERITWNTQNVSLSRVAIGNPLNMQN